MFQFIITNILMVSLGIVLYLVARALPRVDETVPVHGPLGRWVTSEIPERVDVALNSFLGKFLRRTKVFLLKIDYLLTERIKKTKTENGNGKAKIDFNDITGGEDNVAKK